MMFSKMIALDNIKINTTNVFIASVPTSSGLEVFYDKDLLNVSIDGAGRYIETKPDKTYFDLIPSETMQNAKLVINGNNFYWHSDDYYYIKNSMIRRNDGLGKRFMITPSFCFGRTDKGFEISMINNSNDLLRYKTAMYALPLLYKGRDVITDMIDAYRFDARLLFDVGMYEDGKIYPERYPAELPAFDNFPFNWGNSSKQIMKKYYQNSIYKENKMPLTAVGIKDDFLKIIVANGRLNGEPGISIAELQSWYTENEVQDAVLLGTGGDSFMLKDNEKIDDNPVRPVPSYLVFN